MISLTKKINPLILCLIVLFLTANVYATHTVNLSANTIPSYCQESNIWCGAATTQMILEGYPSGTNYSYTQTYIWNQIQFYLNDPGVNWATDPTGLRDTLMNNDGTEPANWVIFAKPSATNLMWDVAYWMTVRSYPTAALIYGWQHWIVIEGLVTDVDPRNNSTVNLQQISIIDPWNPPCPANTSGGVRSTISGSTWYSNYWYTPGNYPASVWNGNYIAVIEPPDGDGEALAPLEPVQGTIISPADALAAAQEWPGFVDMGDDSPYTILFNRDFLEPMLINEDYRGYYIVPLGYEDSTISQGAVLVNAYDASIQEVGVYDHPLTYITEERAVALAQSYLCECDETEPPDVVATDQKQTENEVKQFPNIFAILMFQPSNLTTSRFLPFWNITINTKTVRVTQFEEVEEEIEELPLGD
jgi:hypothetical protein